MHSTIRDFQSSKQLSGACVLIAINKRSRCKTRLAPALTRPARLQLVRSMLAEVLAASLGASAVNQVIVVSPERDSVPAEVPVFADMGESMNVALTQAHSVLRHFGCREVLVLPADLPFITSANIDALVHAARSGGFSIAPNLDGTGTNALCFLSTQPFRFQFGTDSLLRHLAEAQRLRLAPKLVRFPGLQFDVDLPPDLDHLEQQQCLTRQA